MNNLLTFLTAFPGDAALTKWDSVLQKFISGIAKAMTGEGADTSMWATKSDKMIEFYLSNQQWLNPNHQVLTVVTGWLQNVIYGLLTWLAGIATVLMQGSLYLFQVIPQQLTNNKSEFHALFVWLASISIAMSVVGVIFWTFNYARGANDHKVSVLANNLVTSLVLMFVMPALTVFIGWAMTTYVSPIIGTTTQGSLAMKPLSDNTVDMETWAIDGFQHKPFSQNSPQLNDLNDADSFIPDFSESIDAGEIAQINSLASQVNNKSVTPNQVGQTGGKVDSSSVDIKKVGNVFNYQVVPAPTAEAGEHASRYTISKMNIKGATFGVDGGLTSVRYKRYRVQNISAIFSYLIIIILSVLMSIKVGRAALGAGFNLAAGILAIGRDVGTTQPAKTMFMEQINTGLVVMVDVLMLWLSASVITSWPKIVADYVASLGGAGIAAWPIVYVLSMALIALAIYSGTGAIQRVFGIEDGLNDSFRSGSMMTAVSSFVAGGMFNSLANAKDTLAMNKRLDALASDKNDTGRDTQAITNSGDRNVIDDSEVTNGGSNAGGMATDSSTVSVNNNSNTGDNNDTADNSVANNGSSYNPQSLNDLSDNSVSDGDTDASQNVSSYEGANNASNESNDYSNNQTGSSEATGSEIPNNAQDGTDGSSATPEDSGNDNQGDTGVIDNFDSTEPRGTADSAQQDMHEAPTMDNQGTAGINEDVSPATEPGLTEMPQNSDNLSDGLTNQGAEASNEDNTPQNTAITSPNEELSSSNGLEASVVSEPANNGIAGENPTSAEREIRQAYGQNIDNRNARRAQSNHDRAQMIKQQLLQGQPAVHQRPVNRGSSSKVD